MKKLSILLLVAFVFLAIACDDNRGNINPNNNSEVIYSSQVVDGVEIEQSVWEKAFGKNISAENASNLDKYGFNSVTAVLECSRPLNYRNFGEIGNSVILKIGDGWICSEDLFYELYTGNGNDWNYMYLGTKMESGTVERGGSTSGLEYVFELRNGDEWIKKSDDGDEEIKIDFKDLYNVASFISEEGVYQFIYQLEGGKLVANCPVESLMDNYGDDYYLIYKVKFNSKGLLTLLSCDWYDPDSGYIFNYTYTFKDYNNTQKPANFAKFNF